MEPLAQALRENCNIQGILIDNTEHKIAMYADDVLLYINNPEKCLPILLDLFDIFGTYSGYKLNIQKTQILTFNYIPSPELKHRIPIDWSQKVIKYLGIWLTHCPSDLYKKNYVNKRIREDLGNWAAFLLSFSARINIMKMSILPKLSYLFMSLPIKIPISQFQEWDKQISRFI